MSAPIRCPRCGKEDSVITTGCPRRGFRRYGGKLTQGLFLFPAIALIITLITTVSFGH